MVLLAERSVVGMPRIGQRSGTYDSSRTTLHKRSRPVESKGGSNLSASHSTAPMPSRLPALAYRCFWFCIFHSLMRQASSMYLRDVEPRVDPGSASNLVHYRPTREETKKTSEVHIKVIDR